MWYDYFVKINKQERMLSLYSSIKHFIENDTIRINKVVKEIVEGNKTAEDLSEIVCERVLSLGRNILAEIYEQLDEEIRNSIARKKNWNIEHRNEKKTIIDVMGKVEFKRTGYYAKGSGKYVYLLDKLLGYDPGQRITLGAAAKALEEAVESSYRKGGQKVSVTDDEISKQAVKELVHGLKIDMPLSKPNKRKKLRQLHIVADEDHVAAQFWNKKGDLQENPLGNKRNTIIPKLVCVYEDIINESGEMSKNPRYKLIGKRYFSGLYSGSEGNEELWKQVSDYIEATYDTDHLKRVYIAGDGASWIKSGCEYIENSKFVLDKYHMMKYINTSVVHLWDSVDDVKSEIWKAINSADIKKLKIIYKKILNVTESESKKEEVQTALKYLLNNWKGIKVRLEEASTLGCCAEGQVSHVLSARMSSRPMGWSELGCDHMAKLRAYKWNGGKILDLLKYLKKKQAQLKKRNEQEELIKELRKKQTSWKNADETKNLIPGLERSNMKWLRDLINHSIYA